jgi:hypothetical protein
MDMRNKIVKQQQQNAGLVSIAIYFKDKPHSLKIGAWRKNG